MKSVLILVLIIVSLLFLILAYMMFKCSIVNNFQKSAKLKDLCYIYIGEERVNATIVADFPDSIVVEDIEGNIHSLLRCEIYPLNNISKR